MKIIRRSVEAGLLEADQDRRDDAIPHVNSDSADLFSREHLNVLLSSPETSLHDAVRVPQQVLSGCPTRSIARTWKPLLKILIAVLAARAANEFLQIPPDYQVLVPPRK